MSGYSGCYDVSYANWDGSNLTSRINFTCDRPTPEGMESTAYVVSATNQPRKNDGMERETERFEFLFPFTGGEAHSTHLDEIMFFLDNIAYNFVSVTLV